MTSNTLDYGTFEIAAAGMVNRADTAALMSKALGKTVQADQSEPPPKPRDDQRDQQAGMGTDAPLRPARLRRRQRTRPASERRHASMYVAAK